MAALADGIGNKVDKTPSGDIGLEGLRAIWWFGLASKIIAALITLNSRRSMFFEQFYRIWISRRICSGFDLIGIE